MDRDVSVAFFVSLILLHVVEEVTTNDDGALHLGRDDHSFNDLTADLHVTGEGALLVDVLAVDSFDGGAEAEAHVLVVARLALEDFLVEGHTILTLERILDLLFNLRLP